MASIYNSDSITYGWNETYQVIEVQFNDVDTMEYIINDDWIHFNGWIDGNNHQQLVLMCSMNSSSSPRTGTITFKDSYSTAVLTITQEGCPLDTDILFYGTSITFPASGGTQTMQVDYKNADVINLPTSTQSWVTIRKTMSGQYFDGDDKYDQIQYEITMSATTFARQTNLIFSCVGPNGETVSQDNFVVRQSEPEKEPSSISPNVTQLKLDAKGKNIIQNIKHINVRYEGFSALSQLVEPGIDVSWLRITADTTTGALERGFVQRYYFEVDENTSVNDRVGTIVFRGTGDDEANRMATVYVTQYGIEVPDEPDEPVYDYEEYSNFVGYFQSLDGVDYVVKLIGDETSSEFKEIIMAGESPFTVSYAASDTLFDPVKKSTATIKIVCPSYLEHILSPYAQGTKVELSSAGNVKWTGFLTPKIYDQSWVNEWEEIELEASDCIASLQYLDYEPMNERGFVTFKQILDGIMAKCKSIKGYYFPQSKRSGEVYLTPAGLGVYEQNFFSNDTDEPWKLYDVLYEICQYLGLTCIQSVDNLYFLDYGDYLTQSKTNSKYDYYYDGGVHASYWYMGNNAVTITADTFRANDGTISFQPIYNKVVVKDNMYVVEEVFPTIFDDKYLTNINGDFYAAVEVEPFSEPATYPHGSSWGSQKYVTEKDPDSKRDKEDLYDSKYRYFMRIYNHEYWETVYDGGGVSLVGGDAVQLLRNMLQGRLVDLGVVRETYYSYGQKILPNSIDYTRYICIPTKHTDAEQNTGKVVFRLKDGFKMPCMVSKDSYLVFQNSVIWERHNGRPYINPEWCSTANKLHLGNGDSSWDRIAWPRYRLTIGDKCWSSFRQRWVELDDSHNYFEPVMKWQQDNMNYWNTEIECLNQVSWEENIKEAGYVIPLKDVDLSQDIHFEILCPAPSSYGRHDNGDYFMMKHNAYCWISDLVVKIVERGQDVEKQDNDIVYENVVDENSISEATEIEFKLTTYNENTKPSYSNVILITGDTREFLLTIKDRGLSSAEQNAEENCIERFVNQYSTPTKQLSVTLTDNHNTQTYNGIITPFTCQDTIYFPLGAEIDYANSRETITLIESK